MITEECLRILRCPLTHSPLALASAECVARVNAAVAEGRIVNRVGQTVTRPLNGGLVNEQRTVLYAVRENIPCLLVDEAIDLGQPGLVEPRAM